MDILFNPLFVFGCNDELACNYNSDATFNDGSCEYDCSLFTDDDGFAYESIEITVDGGFFQDEIGWEIIDEEGAVSEKVALEMSNNISSDVICKWNVVLIFLPLQNLFISKHVCVWIIDEHRKINLLLKKEFTSGLHALEIKILQTNS